MRKKAEMSAPLLTKEEERLLLKKKNEPAARKKLVDANMPFVLKVAELYKGMGVPMSTLVEEGKKGLIKALEKFDCEKDIKFISYAVWFVKQNLDRKCKSTFTDPRDGRVYKIVKIGSQIWMAENLAYDAKGSKCYGNDESNTEKYGRLYDWDTAMKSCPDGWHLPSNEEWDVLYRYADGKSGTESPYNSKTAGERLKATSGWNLSEKGHNGNGIDDFGFTALPGGYGYRGGTFDDIGNYAHWWSASEKSRCFAYYRGLDYEDNEAYWDIYRKYYFFSVRCIKDDVTKG